MSGEPAADRAGPARVTAIRAAAWTFATAALVVASIAVAAAGWFAPTRSPAGTSGGTSGDPAVRGASATTAPTRTPTTGPNPATPTNVRYSAGARSTSGPSARPTASRQITFPPPSRQPFSPPPLTP